MKVEEIRKDTYVDEYVRLHDADVAALLAGRSQFVDVACPACDRRERNARFEKSGFSFVSCSACDTLYVSPRPTPAQLASFYEQAASFRLFNEKIFPASEDARRAHIFAPRARRVAELCERFGAARGVLVDVGAGFGTFCEEARRLGFFRDVIPVEPSPGLAATCRAKGFSVVEKTVEQASLEQADVITNFELIEHLFDARAFVASCARVLSPGGLLILSTVNIRGFDLALLGPLSENVDGPEHINYFHEHSLRALVASTGLEVVEVLTPGKLDAELVRKKALSGAIDLSQQPFLRRVLIDEFDALGARFQQFLSDNLMSSHIWLVARKASS